MKKTTTTTAVQAATNHHDVNIGGTPPPDARRDAIHFAVAPVRSADRFLPGEHVGLNEKGEAAQVDNPIGIIDPFLKRAVEPGEPVWIMLYQKTVQNLRHDWDHPAFTKAEHNETVKKSESWLRGFASECEITYELLLDGARKANADGGYYLTIGTDTPNIAYDQIQTFWEHYAIVTGDVVVDKEKTFINCSC